MCAGIAAAAGDFGGGSHREGGERGDGRRRSRVSPELCRVRHNPAANHRLLHQRLDLVRESMDPAESDECQDQQSNSYLPFIKVSVRVVLVRKCCEQ